jgi:hypothetical protein
VKTSGYCTDVFFRQASGWMRSQNQAGKPFFAYISTNAPHGPFIARPGDAALYQGKVTNTKPLAHFYGMIHNIDENIGKLLADLREWGIERDTVVIFMNDNGTALGETVFNAGMRGKKGSPGSAAPAPRRSGAGREHGNRARPRRSPRTSTFSRPSRKSRGSPSADGVQRQIEGRSLVPLLENPGADWPDRLLFTHQGRWPKFADPNDRSSRWPPSATAAGPWSAKRAEWSRTGSCSI